MVSGVLTGFGQGYGCHSGVSTRVSSVFKEDVFNAHPSSTGRCRRVKGEVDSLKAEERRQTDARGGSTVSAATEVVRDTTL